MQQTVGAFVLYPYAGADANRNRFVEAIGTVGFGGVPFLPSRRAEVTNLLRNIIQMSTDAVEDTAVELSSIDERRRIEWAHEYGLIAIVPSREQLDYILQSGIYHIREPERRFYRECRLAGFAVAVYDESSGEEQVFDVGQLRLRFSVSKQGDPAINVRFDPWTARFSGNGIDFTWSELMFRPADCVSKLFSS